MKANAIVIRHLDILEVEVDFSDLDNIAKANDAEYVSTIHTKITQAISAKLGIHLIGFVDRDGDDINNKKACEISGYDYIGSSLLLCKCDDGYNPYPLEEDELSRVHTYLTTGKIANNFKSNVYERFCKQYGVNPLLPSINVKPTFITRELVPYVIILKYDLNELDFTDYMKLGETLFHYADTLVNEFTEVEDVNLSPDKKYYIKCFMNNKGDNADNSYYIFIQINDGQDIFIKNPKDILESLDKDVVNEYSDDIIEEVLDNEE